MEIRKSKTKILLFIITVFLSNVFVQGYYVLLPIGNTLYELYPDQTGLINFVLSGDFLIMTFASMLVTVLCRYFSKKTLMIAGGTISAVSGLALMAVDSPLYMCFMKAVFAAGVSVIAVCGIAILAEVYADEPHTYDTLLGFYNASMALIGAAMSAAAGSFAVGGYKHVLRVYWILVLSVIFFIFFLPKITPVKNNEVPSGTGTAAAKKKLSLPFWWNLINWIAFNYCFSVLQFFVSVYVDENKIGTAAFSGYVSTVSLVGSGIACILFGVMHKKLDKKLVILYYIIMPVSLLLLYLVQNGPATLIAYFLVGFAYGGAFAYNYAYIPGIVAQDLIDTSIGLITSGYSLAYFATTYIVTWTMSILGNSGLTRTLVVPVIVAVLILISQLIVNKKA